MGSRATWRTTALALGIAAGYVAGGSLAGSASGPALRSATVTTHHHVLVSSTGRTLYVLSSEAGGHLKCTGSCLGAWLMVTAPRHGGSLSHGAGVLGHVASVKRGARAQATYNGYPLYTYVGDAKAGVATGLGLTLGSGTWLLVNARATSATATPTGRGASSSGSGAGW